MPSRYGVIVGDDLQTVEFGSPLGMPLCKNVRDGIWEVRCNLTGNRIARVLFCTIEDALVLLHAFIKKTRTTPKEDLDLAIKRRKSE